MPFQLSPGVNVSEIDLTTVVPAVATTEGAIAGVFSWGPTNERVLVSSEVELTRKFGKPKDSNYETFFTAANFLAYSDALYVTRVTENAEKASANAAFEAAYEGDLGNAISVSYCTDAAEFSETAVANVTISVSTSSSTGTLAGLEVDIDDILVGDVIVLNEQELRVTAIGDYNALDETVSVTFATKYVGYEDVTDAAFEKKWGFASVFDAAPGSNEVHFVVYDRTGAITGTAGAILEVYNGVSTVSGAKLYDGSTNYLDEVLEQRSAYVRMSSGYTLLSKGYEDFANGDDGESESTVSIAAMVAGYDLYQTAEEVDISLILHGAPRAVGFTNYLIDNIAEKRRDCVVFISPNVTPNGYNAQGVLTALNGVTSSSYAVVDTGYRYQYDKYNDKYRWTPMNGDVAGLCARTDDVRDPWYSPAGYNRGFLKNVIKLGINPTKAERDLLYKNGVNPVITQSGQGTVLFGDKTYLNQPSAFDRINVRRLFIVLEKAIAIAAKRSLFEFNDEFTRAQFRNLVEPYLRDVQGRRGIYDFLVVCDGTNNTAEVIDRNEFVGDIYIKPARSINFIQLNFIAVRTGVEFAEIVGQAT
jgi:phage tail sheath protein FI